MKRRSKKSKIELPDSILSIIFSKLGLKDLVKTSTLSKQWRHELGLRIDLNFDLHNMFNLEYNTIQESHKSLPLFKGFQSEFVTRLDQFMLHYQGAIIRSVRVNFPLDTKHSVVIDRVISKGIAKGSERIELLFSNETIDPIRYLERKESYRFSSTLLSKTDSLTYLHLPPCSI
ncbi:F-box protein [Medicago truncatula]|uniref:F-box protein n=1 Tax=Medicago truncatula TaxID=3880 RepID=A0A072U372_MEDTR|nr:F-box protein [Medicago truncatula]